MKNFQTHALNDKCAIDLKGIDDYDYSPSSGMSLPFVLSRKLDWDGKAELQHPVFHNEVDGFWRLMGSLQKKIKVCIFSTPPSTPPPPLKCGNILDILC